MQAVTICPNSSMMYLFVWATSEIIIIRNIFVYACILQIKFTPVKTTLACYLSPVKIQYLFTSENLTLLISAYTLISLKNKIYMIIQGNC